MDKVRVKIVKKDGPSMSYEFSDAGDAGMFLLRMSNKERCEAVVSAEKIDASHVTLGAPMPPPPEYVLKGRGGLSPARRGFFKRLFGIK